MTELNKQVLRVPERKRHDWSQSVMRDCDFCSQWELTVKHENGGCICASCCDAEYTSELTRMIVSAIDRADLAEKKITALFKENVRLKSGIAGLVHLGIRHGDIEVMRIAGDAQLATPCTDSIIERIALDSLATEPVAVNDDMAYAFHHAISDSSLGADEAEEIKIGLRAAFANVAAPPAPVVPEECPREVRDMIASHSDALFNDEDAEEIWNACRAAMLQGTVRGK